MVEIKKQRNCKRTRNVIEKSNILSGDRKEQNSH